MNVAMIERDKIGGTCLNYGCDPTKTLLHTAHMLYQARHADSYDLLSPIVLAMHAGIPAKTLASTIISYPTMSEGIRWAADRIG